MCVWQPLVYDAQSLSGDFYYGKKIKQRVCLKCYVSNGIRATESLKMLQKCLKYLSGIKHSVRVVRS